MTTTIFDEASNEKFEILINIISTRFSWNFYDNLEALENISSTSDKLQRENKVSIIKADKKSFYKKKSFDRKLQSVKSRNSARILFNFSAFHFNRFFPFQRKTFFSRSTSFFRKWIQWLLFVSNASGFQCSKLIRISTNFQLEFHMEIIKLNVQTFASSVNASNKSSLFPFENRESLKKGERKIW